MKLAELTLGKNTSLLLGSYVKSPRHAVVLSGPHGSGLYTIAYALAREIVEHPSEIILVSPDDKGTITIERIRALYGETRSIRSTAFAIIFDDIDTMSHEAQNSFLKLLEEPVDNIFFILTTHYPQKLLPTVLSRTQTIDIDLVSKESSESLIRTHDVTDLIAFQQILFIASGRPAEISRLAIDKEYFASKIRIVKLAKDFITSTAHERLKLVSQIDKRDEAIEFVATLSQLLGFKLSENLSEIRNKTTLALEKTVSRLISNGHVRTQLMYLALNVV